MGKPIDEAPQIYIRFATVNDVGKDPMRDRDLFAKNQELRKKDFN